MARLRVRSTQTLHETIARPPEIAPIGEYLPDFDL